MESLEKLVKCFNVPIVDFERVNGGWVCGKNYVVNEC